MKYKLIISLFNYLIFFSYNLCCLVFLVKVILEFFGGHILEILIIHFHRLKYRKPKTKLEIEGPY